MKCLPASKVPKAQGVGLHDWHAEILAIRAFNRLLLEECQQHAKEGSTSSNLIRPRADSERIGEGSSWHQQPFALRDGITLHMYCSQTPCKVTLSWDGFLLPLTSAGGDASMELTMAGQADASPWTAPEPSTAVTSPESEDQLLGRGYFDQLGIVRRKPARGDAPLTLSKSCSDKLALKQCTSLLSSLTSLLVSPQNVYLHSLILPDAQYSAASCERAFSAQGRMKPLDGRHWPGGYSFQPFRVTTTTKPFHFSKSEVLARSKDIVASQVTAYWTCRGVDEGLIGGVLQGNKPFRIPGASHVSRRKMWSLALDVAGLLGGSCAVISRQLSSPSYGETKAGELLNARRKVKGDARDESLRNWTINSGDDGFALERQPWYLA